MRSLADGFVEALRALDGEALAQLLAPDAVGWRNIGDRTRSRDEITGSLALERTLVRSSNVDLRHQTSTEDGFLVQFVFAGTTRGGEDFRVPICMVARVSGGRISELSEYADSADLEPLRRELARSRP